MKESTKIRYWRTRARNAEQLLKGEAHINSFMIAWLKRVHPDIHKEMTAFYRQQSNARMRSTSGRLQTMRRERISAVK